MREEGHIESVEVRERDEGQKERKEKDMAESGSTSRRKQGLG